LPSYPTEELFMDIAAFLPHLAGLRIETACRRERSLHLHLASRAQTVRCPLCQRRSTRIHSWYRRTLVDLPWGGFPVVLHVGVRRFVCATPTCPRRIFAERFPTLVAPHARQTAPARLACQQVGLALGGQAGTRLAALLGLPTSRASVLRRVLEAPLAAVECPRVLGIDDWSWRRGHRYGTLLCDLERRRLVDLLADRSAETVAAWLKAHPGVEIISRDRGGLYAEGARRGAPAAMQVADRWHLLDNLVDALERLLLHKKATLQEAATSLCPNAGNIGAPPDPDAVPTPRSPVEMYSGRRKHPQPRRWRQRAEIESLRRHASHVACYEQVHALAAVQADKADIARMVGVSRRTVYRYLAMSAPPERRQPRRRGAVLDPYRSYLLQRWAQGCHNAHRLWREIHAQGFAYSVTNVARFAAQIRRGEIPCPAVAPPGSNALALPASAPLLATHWSPQRVAGLYVSRPADLTETQQTYLRAVVQADTTLAVAYSLAQAFATMLRSRQGERLDHWIAAAQACGIAELRRFASGLLADRDAVQAGLTLCWSQGQVEGHVHRLKLVKRSMYGRAGFTLLRQRVLKTA
jgi:transposase